MIEPRKSKARKMTAGLRRSTARLQPKAADKLPLIKKMKAKPMEEAQPKTIFTPPVKVKKDRPAKARSNNMLDNQEIVLVTDEIRALAPRNWEPIAPGSEYVRILPGGKTDAEIAASLADRLGFPISEKNVESIRLIWVGKLAPTQRQAAAYDPAMEERLAKLEQAFIASSSFDATAVIERMNILHETITKTRSEERASLKKATQLEEQIAELREFYKRILTNLERMNLIFTSNIDIPPLARMMGEFNHLKQQVAEIQARGYVAPIEDPDIATARQNRQQPVLPSERVDLTKEDMARQLGERFRVKTTDEGKQT